MIKPVPERPELIMSGEDGNAFFILGRAKRALKMAGADKEYIDQFFADASSGDYDHVIQTCMKYFTVS